MGRGRVQDQERITEGMVLALAKDTAPPDGQWILELQGTLNPIPVSCFMGTLLFLKF